MRMRRRINHTGRKKIGRSAIRIELVETEGKPPTFKAQLEFENLRLPRESRIFIEPYYKSSFMRFDFGTIGVITEPEDTCLKDLDQGGILFRVLITETSDDVGRLLASAEGIQPKTSEEKEGQEPLIHLRGKDLGSLSWRLDLSTALDKPQLIVNNRIPGFLSSIKHDPVYQGLIFPGIIREILNYILEDHDSDEDEGGEDRWQSKWLTFAKIFADGEILEDNDMDDRRDWVDGVVSEFCREKQISEKIIKNLGN